MPRVSQEHLDARRRQILDAARRCFVRNGFHATSMQDVVSESNLSVGAVYRYFRGKDEIVTAIATDTLAMVADEIEAVFDTTPPPPIEEILERILDAFQHLDATQDLAKIAVQVWGEALHSPSLAECFTEAIGSVRRVFTNLVEDYQDRALITRDVPAEHVASVIVGLLHGFMVQHVLPSDTDAAVFRTGWRALLESNHPNITPYRQKAT